MAVAATGPMLTAFDAPHCEVALELVEEHFPLVLVRWSGHLEPQHILRLIRFFDANADRAAAEGKRLVHICDARDAALPSPLVRDMLVDWLADRPRGATGHRTPSPLTQSPLTQSPLTQSPLTQSPLTQSPLTQSFVVASDPLIRGVVASLKWATGRGDGIRVMATIEQAIVAARGELERAGVEVPEILLTSART